MCAEQAIASHPRWAVGEIDREVGVVKATVRLGPVFSVETVEVTVTPVAGGTDLRLELTPQVSPVRQATRERMCRDMFEQIVARLG